MKTRDIRMVFFLTRHIFGDLSPLNCSSLTQRAGRHSNENWYPNPILLIIVVKCWPTYLTSLFLSVTSTTRWKISLYLLYKLSVKIRSVSTFKST